MFTVLDIAKAIDGKVIGDEAIEIVGIASIDQASEGDLTFAEAEPYLTASAEGNASAIIVPSGFTRSSKTLIQVRNPRVAIAIALSLLYPTETLPPGIHPSAMIDTTAYIDPSAHIGPHCVIGRDVHLGARTVLMGGNHIGAASVLRSDVCLHPNVVVYARTRIGYRVTIHAGTTIGSDGYGYVFDQGRHRKVPQIGHVVIGDDVEIGANAAIDRGALGATVIGAGTKIDNLVHVAHNVTMGRHCLVLGQVGFAGSTQLGDYVVVASQSGISGHLKLGDRSTVGAKSGVMRDVPEGETVLGHPAVSAIQAKRQWVATAQLPAAMRRLGALEKGVAKNDKG
ncbi:UDP-3-O-(3-hydroxymyristoyl)glucosamine N-acyltransferase [Verrucomicrobia bacterium LW23]|nr:UDP-3-O-(3-hydroxymyristoyl)glucosamine N-acyltransferase [Verrucomicrobia bacterium LW23]